jgi:hypothetical protein
MRTFVALVLPDSFKAELWDSLDEITSNHPDFRWTKDDNLHFTLAFLGEVEKIGIPVLIEAVKTACKGVKAIRRTEPPVLNRELDSPLRGSPRIQISGGKLLTLPKRRPANGVCVAN